MGKFSLSKIICIVFAFCAAAVLASPAQAFKTLANFDQANGYAPDGSLVQGIDGNFYGTTFRGGASNLGTVFTVTPAGTLTTLYS